VAGPSGPARDAALGELGIRGAEPPGATLVGCGVGDYPGIQAIEPAFSVGGAPGVDPADYLGYEARLADVRDSGERLLQHFAARCAEAGVRHEEIKAVGSPHEVIEREAQS